MITQQLYWNYQNLKLQKIILWHPAEICLLHGSLHTRLQDKLSWFIDGSAINQNQGYHQWHHTIYIKRSNALHNLINAKEPVRQYTSHQLIIQKIYIYISSEEVVNYHGFCANWPGYRV